MAEWNSLYVVCDVGTSECPAEDVLSVRPSVYLSVDLTSRSLTTQMFEEHAVPASLHWLIFCGNCNMLLEVVNMFEDTHDLHGYFTYEYQWILVTNSSSVDEASLGSIMNLLVIESDNTMYTAIFGTERYLQKIKCPLKKRPSYIFPNLLTGFNNITLVFATIPWSPWVTKDSSGVYSGYYVHLMYMIAQTLNFTVRIVASFDGEYGSLENGEWTGLIRQLMDKQADVAAVLTQSYERAQYITQVTTPVRIGSEVVMYHKPEPTPMSIDLLMKPFSTNVWLVFLATLIGTMATFHVSQMVKGRKFSDGDYGAYILRSTLNQSSVWSPHHASSRIIYGFYTFGWIILVATYTGYLVSLLSVKKDIVPFTTMAEVADNNEYRVGVLGKAYFYSTLINTNFTEGTPFWHLQSKLQRDIKDDPSVIDTDIQNHKDRLLTEKYVFIGSSDSYLNLASESCRVGLLKEKGEITADGFDLQKNSAYAKDFSRVLSKIQEGELDIELRKRFMPQPAQCSTSLSTVSLENIHGVFYILSGGLAIAFVILLGELCYSKWLDEIIVNVFKKNSVF